MLGRHIGPYRIEKELGSGGMGVVYLAFDERLRRRVAIKSIHTGREISQERRKRLIREARAAARLNHPAIASVYDILQQEGRDFIVMEYVEGKTLTTLMGKQPMDVARAVDLARQIAEGLHAAHSQGIVHRDLKTENIIVTREGRVKILDFGLAKNLEPEDGEVTLTADGVVMGTSSAMSPEQAMGREVDARSDLFSLGTLLYTMVTGRHPFQGASPLETMRRVARHNPPPPSQLNPEVPEELSLIVENLLEKNPKNRPASALEVAMALEELSTLWRTGTVTRGSVSEITFRARRRRILRRGWIIAAAVGVLLAGAAGAGWWAVHRPVPSRVVAVLKPRIAAAEDPNRAPILGAVARTAILDTIANLRGLAAPATREVDAGGGDIRKTARITGADEVIATTLEQHGPTAQLTLQRLAAGDAHVLWSATFTVPSDDPALLAEAVRAHLLRAFAGYKPRRRGRARPPSPRALTEYVRLRLEHASPPPGVTRREILEALDHLRRDNPRFLLPYLEEAEIARYLFISEKDGRELDRARDLLRRARDLAPDDPRVVAAEASLELGAGDLQAAERAVSELERLAPGSPQALRSRAELLMKRGEASQALRLLQRLADTYPSVASFWALAEAELHSGHVREARRHLREGLAVNPSSRNLRAKLAQLELLSGDPAEAERLYAKLADEFHNPLHYSNLGVARLLQGKIEGSLEAYRAASRLRKDPFDLMSIGDCLLLLGREQEARAAYRRALELSGQEARGDRLAALSVRAQCLAHLGRSREAIKAVQDELELRPREPMVYFDAALVYTTLGDPTTAVVYAEKAVELGLNRRWLQLPFFAPLREDPEFRRLLNPPAA